jgi:hypothetical protein
VAINTDEVVTNKHEVSFGDRRQVVMNDQPRTPNNRFDGDCFYCGQKGHRKATCFKRVAAMRDQSSFSEPEAAKRQRTSFNGNNNVQVTPKSAYNSNQAKLKSFDRNQPKSSGFGSNQQASKFDRPYYDRQKKVAFSIDAVEVDLDACDDSKCNVIESNIVETLYCTPRRINWFEWRVNCSWVA